MTNENLHHTESHQLTNVADIKKFMLAGKAIFTLESIRTGKWLTYQIKKKIFKKDINGESVEIIFYFVSVLTGPENETSYTYLGTISSNFVVKLTAKSKIDESAISFKALSFFVSLLRNDELHKEIKVYHKGVCGKCGRALTTPNSLISGLGPICRGYDKLTVAKTRKRKIQKINRMLLRV